MKILFLAGSLPYAGMAGGHSVVYQRMVRLARKGHHVGLAAFCPPEHSPQARDIQSKLSEVELLDLPRPPMLPKQLAAFFLSAVPLEYIRLRDPAMARLVGKMIQRSRYEMVVAEFSSMGQYLYRNPWLPAVRRIVSCHHSTSTVLRSAIEVLGPTTGALRDWLLTKGLSRYEYSMYKSMDRVLVFTPEERYTLLHHAPDTRAEVVPSAVEAAYFAPARNPYREQAILFTGQYTDEPNHDALLWFCRTAWPELRRRHPQLVFYVVGPDPPRTIRLRARHDHRIRVTGWVPDIRPYLHRAQVFICPVRIGAGMRGKILEAMAAGIPVVSSSLGMAGIPGHPGENCFLADRSKLFVRFVDLLLGDADLRERLAHNARAMVAERFTWERHLERLEEVLEDVRQERT